MKGVCERTRKLKTFVAKNVDITSVIRTMKFSRGKALHRNVSRKGKIITTFVILLLVATVTLLFVPLAAATPTSITSITPESGHVGDTIRVVGEIDTTNGTYTIFFDEEKVQNGTASNRTVNATFLVPHRPKGNYAVRLHDETTDYSDTRMFSLEIAYLIEALIPAQPKQLQEGQSTEIRVNVTGGEKNTCYSANITVTDPSSVVFLNDTVQLTNTTDIGNGWGSSVYPRDFGTNAHTNLTGLYKIAFNGTLATGNFTVGLTNATQYYRFQVVHIQATNYTIPNESVWINITLGQETAFSQNVSAVDGVVNASWKIPALATYGTYTVTITNSTPLHTIKSVPDTQNFTVTRVVFLCQIQIRNLDNENVSGITVDAYLPVITTPIVTRTSDKDGLTEFSLEAGNYSFKASLNNVEIGNIPVLSLSENITEILVCRLAHIRTSVKDVDQTPLPFINITFIYEYTTTNNKTISMKDSFETNSTGIVVLPNTFTNISYVIEARRYDYLFNTTTIGNLTTSLWVNVTCPTRSLFIHILDSDEHPLENVQVTVHEWSSERLMLSETTNGTGNIIAELTFGRYKITASTYSTDFKEMIVLNKTILDLIEDQFLVIYCKIFGVALSVKVVDYFERPIPNAMVNIERKSEQGWTKIEPYPKTNSEGIVSLPNIGGDYLISIYATGSLDETRTMSLATSQQVVIKLNKYVLVGGYLVETSQFITYISLVLLIVASGSSLTYKRYATKSAKKKTTPKEVSK